MKGGDSNWDSEGFLRDIEEMTEETNRRNQTKKMRKENKMSFVQLGNSLATARPEEPVAEGEYKVRITYADQPAERSFIIVRAELVEDPYAKEVGIFLNLPGTGRTPKEENRNLLLLQDFYKCFGFDPTQQYEISAIYPEGWVGAEGWVILGPPIDDGKGYGPQNRIKRYLQRR